MANQTPWTDDEDDMIRTGQARGWSFARIAKEVGATRNAVAGRVYRLRKKEAKPAFPYDGHRTCAEWGKADAMENNNA